MSSPQRRHRPNVPASIRARAASTSSSSLAALSRRARSRCWANTWLAAAACDPYVIWPGASIPPSSSSRSRARSATSVARAAASSGGVHRWMVRPACAERSWAILPGSTAGRRPTRARTPMTDQPATAIDPVCGMTVDTRDLAAVDRARRDDLLVLRPRLPARVPRRSRPLPRSGSRPVDVTRSG